MSLQSTSCFTRSSWDSVSMIFSSLSHATVHHLHYHRLYLVHILTMFFSNVIWFGPFFSLSFQTDTMPAQAWMSPQTAGIFRHFYLVASDVTLPLHRHYKAFQYQWGLVTPWWGPCIPPWGPRSGGLGWYAAAPGWQIYVHRIVRTLDLTQWTDFRDLFYLFIICQCRRHSNDNTDTAVQK